MKFSLKHPRQDRWASYDPRSGAAFTGSAASCHTWDTPEEAERWRKLYEQALRTALLVQNIATGEIVPPPYDEHSLRFRGAWRKLFPDTSSEDFLVLDNCAGLRFGHEDEESVTFVTDGEGLLLPGCTVEVQVRKHWPIDPEDPMYPVDRIEVTHSGANHRAEFEFGCDEPAEFIDWLADRME